MTGSDCIVILSSDDEALPFSPVSKPNPKPTSELKLADPSPLLGAGAFYQSIDPNSTVRLENDYNAKAAKRRRLNPSPHRQLVHATTRTFTDGTACSVTGYANSPKNDSFAELDDDDPILFTSSAHGEMGVRTVNRNEKGGNVLDIQSEDSDCSLPEDIFALSNQSTCTFQKSSSTLSEKTRAVLVGLSAKDSNSRALYSQDRDEDRDTTLEHIGKPSKKSRLTEEDKLRAKERQEAEARERQQAKDQKAKEKESELLRKRAEKEEKAKQKRKDAELAEVNKAKLDKKDSTPEMIVDLPASLHGQRVDTQTREFLKNLEVETASYESGIPDVIKWRRKVKATWNSENARWEPLPRMRIEDEKHVMCILLAADFISLSTATDEAEDLATHVSELRTAYPGCRPIYLIEGLTKKLRESKAAANRQYQNEVLNKDPPDSTSSTTQTSKRKKPPPLIVDEEVIEDALLRLQVIHKCLIHHTATYVETAEWIATFTQHISTIPYKLHRLSTTTSTSSCLEPGQVKTGVDATDTYSKVLQEIIRVTPPIAQAIINEYPTLSSLSWAFRRADQERDVTAAAADAGSGDGGGKGGELILQHLQKAANRNGGFSDRCVGKAISRRVYAVFMGEDPGSTRV